MRRRIDVHPREPVIDDEESRLIALSAAGDTEAYEALMRRHQDYAFRLCLAVLRDRHDAEECAQEAFFKAFRALSRFEGRSGFRTWLTRICVNQCKDQLRKRKRRAARSLDAMAAAGEPLPAALVSAPSPEPAPALSEAALERLSPGERDLLALVREEEGISYQELAGRLGLSLDGVKGRLKRAREKLRHYLRPPDV